MDSSDALRSAGRPLLAAPVGVLPFYLLAAAVTAVARVPLLVGAAAAFVSLARAGRIEPVARELAAVDPGQFEPGPAGTPPSLPPGLADALSGLVTPFTVATLVTAVAVAVLAGTLARAATAAGTIHAVTAQLTGGAPAERGVGGVAADWRRFLVLRVVRLLAAVVAAGAFVAAAGLAAVGGLAALVATVVALAGVVVLVATWLALAFAGQAVVVDRAGPGAAVRRSLAFLRRRPGDALVLVVVAAGLAGVGGVGVLLATAAGAPRASGLVTALVLPPVYDGFKTALYLPRVDEGPTGVAVTPGRLVGGLRRGVRALGAFGRDHPLAWGGALATFALGGVAGYRLAVRYATPTTLPVGEGASSLGPLPAGAFVNIAANNWLVGAETAFGGAALGVPAAAGLLFNGVVVGLVGGLVDPRAFVALVAPHGVLEVPALAVAGGVGYHLGGVVLGALRGRQSQATVARRLRASLRVLVGLAVAFVVAAAVEAFLTPTLAARVLGG